MLFLNIILLFCLFGQYQMDDSGIIVDLLIKNQTGKEIPDEPVHIPRPFPTGIDEKLLNEFKANEEIIIPNNQSYDSHMMIASTNRFNSSKYSNPWIAVIQRDGVHFCTGSILNRQWIVTAAHCFETVDPVNYTIMTGTTSRADGNEYRVAKIVNHPRYDACNHKSADIALVRINGSIDLSDSIKAIDLPSSPLDEPKPGDHLMSAGWGTETINSVGTEKYLGEIWLTVIPLELCSNGYKKLGTHGHWIFRSQICTWNLNQRICQGNSGGPAVAFRNEKPVLVGTVSYGVKCLDRYPVVFSKVSNFLTWINDVISKN